MKRPVQAPILNRLRNLGRGDVRQAIEISDRACHFEYPGVGAHSIGHWEIGYSQPKAYLIPRIIDFLGCASWAAPANFGEWLIMARRAVGLSRKRLAKRLGVHESTVCRWETGRKRPAPNLVARLKAILAGGPGEYG